MYLCNNLMYVLILHYANLDMMKNRVINKI